MKRALVTGGAGFIGSHLVDHLLETGWRVRAVDDFSTGSPGNIRHLDAHPDFECVEDTAENADRMRPLVAEADAVFHLAAAVGVKMIVEDPVRTIRLNVKLTETVLELCRARRAPVFLASSSEVYGKSPRAPFGEADDLVLGPTTRSRWSYAASKIVDEFLGRAYWKQYGVPAVSGRFFNTIGPRQTGQYGMVVPRFVAQALGGEPLTVYGDGNQTRCFTWVGDVVRAVAGLTLHPDARGEIFNIGGTEEISVLDLARRVIEKTGSSSEIRFVPYDEAYESGFEDMLRRVPDTRKIAALTGWQPSLTLDEMLDRIVASARARRS